MAGIKSLDASLKKWEGNAIGAAGNYVLGARSPKRPWAQSAIAGAANYKTQVLAAANAGRFEKMIAKAGDAAWSGGIEKKGEANYQVGVSGSGPTWGAGFSPFQQAYQSFPAQKRGPRNSPQNYANSQAVGQLFAQVKSRLVA